ncbi:metallophosphoesterase family protein [Paraburkholderia flagellata]|uniref:metallophosphoesterase family protein n=1 Tax=Paraburkholderia flagellata TaxID=2883241 RepID=UPI001F3F6C0B|nr:metallophosphoesterase family protein [Paraburkholderia flagellata]
MRFHVLSDLHLHEEREIACDSRVRAADADVMVLAGDIDYVERIQARFSSWPYDVLYVRGNHDVFFRPYETAIGRAATAMSTGRVRMLEHSIVNYHRIRVIGCCLWTDFELVGSLEDVVQLTHVVGADFRCLRRTDGKMITPWDLRAEHLLSVRWLERVLREPFDGSTIVVSHHAPHRRSLDPNYGVDWSSCAFATDLSRLLRMAELWIHGHTHVFADYKEKGCRVVCNAAGSTKRPNAYYIPDFVVEV